MAGILQLLGFLCLIGGTLSAACSTINVQTNVTACLDQVKTGLTDVTSFFFGTAYWTLCPRGPATGIAFCFSVPSSPDSISTKLFPSGPGMNLAELDRYLDMTFVAEPETYTACGNTYTIDQRWTKRIDPTEDFVMYPWYARHLPTLSWTSTPGELYSLVVYDVGAGITHGIYMNIDGNNVDFSSKIKPYHGPLNTMDIRNPYIWMVFRQPNGRITLSQEWLQLIERGVMGSYTIEGFANDTGLIGPIAANWIAVKGDVYASQVMLDRRVASSCPIHVSKELMKKPRPFIPQPASLSVWMDVKFTSNNFDFSVCCTKHAYRARNISANPLGNTVVPTAEVRSEVTPSFSFMKSGFFFNFAMATDFGADLYTLVTVDPDVPYPMVGTQERPLVHQMIVNIASGDTNTGDVVQPYMGPAPPDDKPHYYYFLLYQQQTTLNAGKIPQYAGSSCSASLAGRCLYNITGMVQENNLTLVGVSWMVAEKDDYVIYRNVQSNPNDEAQQCQGQPGYSDPCVADDGACSSANLKTDVTSCLDQVKANLTDVTSFYFGTAYYTICPQGPGTPGIAFCFSVPNPPASISTKLFPSGPGMDLAELDRYLDMTFVSEPGNYTGCGNTFISDQRWTKRIDPTEDFVMYPWYARHLPTLSWDSTPGELYSLVVYAVGAGITHGIYMNINGNNIDSSDKIKSYFGPLNTVDVRNPYIFMVFRQPSGRFTLSQEWLQLIERGVMGSYTIEGFVNDTGLIGPIAANWIVVLADAYASQMMLDRRSSSSCPQYVSKELMLKPRPFIPQSTYLSIWMDVKFTSNNINFSVCCRTHVYRARNITANPLGNTVVPTAEVRSEVAPSFSFMKSGFFFNFAMATNFGADLYTLVAVDPDVPYPMVGTQERPLLHQMIVNIAGGDTTTGDVVQPYMGPAPPDDKPHYYYFLLYKQQQTINAGKMPQYAGSSCSASLAGRCLYNITGMVQENNLTLVGVSWIVAEKDDYVIYRNVQSNPNDEAQQCQGQPGYSNPCVADDETPSMPCSATNVQTDVTSCLDQVKANLTDVTSFFFGTAYYTICPQGPGTPGIAFCFSVPNPPASISTKLFPSGPGMDLAELDTYLEMEFVSEAGNYTGCGNTFISDQRWTKRIDPTEDFVMYPWYARHLPTLSWDSSPGELYSLVVYAVGAGITHGIYMNINGNNIDASDGPGYWGCHGTHQDLLPQATSRLSQALKIFPHDITPKKIKPYHGPLSTVNIRNPYIFMVFRQPNGRITLSQEWLQLIERGIMGSYNIEGFVNDTGLIGPIAANWIVVLADAYASQMMLDSRSSSSCPIHVSKELMKKPRPFIPQSTYLSVWLDVKFTSDNFNFFVCCRTGAYRGRNITANPLGNTVIPTAEVKSEVTPSFSFMKSGFFFNFAMATNFGTDLYTLVAVDPDVPYPMVGTQMRPLVHQMIVNIARGDTNTGDVVQPYMGPAPPDDKPHYYYFLLYQQQTTLNSSKMPQYAGSSCSTRLAGRCLYNITGMVQENNLTLVGVSWMVAEKDDYVIYRNVQSNPNDEPQQCEGQPGYNNPCVTDAGTKISHGSIVALALLLVPLL